jgi:hypothetical protein
MFQLIKRLLQWFGFLSRESLQDQYIFKYNDGTMIRSADPVAIEQSLIDSLGEDWRQKVISLRTPKQAPIGAIGDIATNMDANRDQTRKDILAAIDKAFDVHPYVGVGWPDAAGNLSETAHGLLEPMRLGLLTGYCLFCNDLIRASRRFTTAQSRASPSPDNPTTPNGVASSSPGESSSTPETVASETASPSAS